METTPSAGAAAADLSPPTIRMQTERILASNLFANTESLRNFLRYCMERALAGETEKLKEYSIGVEVFGRGADFDPRIDPIVRVQARRLRSRLQQYYRAEARPGEMVIELPKGSYVPVFRRGEHDSESVSAASEAKPRTTARPGQWWWKAATMITLAVCVLQALLYWSPWLHRGAPVLEIKMRQITQDPGLSAYPALSPDGKWIVYASDRSSAANLSLWKQAVDGGQPVRLTNGEANDISPAISPDGRWIAYESGLGRHMDIFLQPLAGGSPRRVSHFALDPRFSPDGASLAFWKRDPSTNFGRAYVVPVYKNLEPVQVAKEFDDVHAPVWTPDGKHLLICGTRRSGGGPEEEHDFWVVPAEAGPARKTGAMALLQKGRINPHILVLSATAFQWFRSGLLFCGARGGQVGLWHLALSKSTWRAQSQPQSVAGDADNALHPSVQGERFVFTNATSNLDVWSLPLDANLARVTGPVQRLTEHPAEDHTPSISVDGRTLVFLSSRTRRNSIWKMNLPERSETELSVPGPPMRLKISADGRTAVYRVFEGSGILKQAIYATDLQTGQTRRICADCGGPTSVTPDGRLVIYELGSAVARMGAVQIATGEKAEFLQHSHHAVRAARVSPDGKWVAFHLDRGLDGKRIYVAPFRGGAPIAESEWRPLTESTGSHEEPWWSPNSQYLYYLSDRDGWRCVWAQKLRPGGTAAGEPIPIQHFHQVRRTPLSFVARDPLYVGLSVAQDRLVLTLAEVASNIWMAETR